MSAFVEAFSEKYEAAALKLSDGKTIRTIAENLFWFLVLLSWLPVIAGFVGFVDNFIPGRWGPAKPTHWLAVPVDHVFLVIAAVITIIAACLRRPVLLLCAIAPLLANFLGKAGLPGLGHPGFNLSIAYLAAFVVSFALFAWSAHLRTSYVASFFVICFWETSIQLFNEGWTWIENWFAAYEVETPQVHGQTILHNVLKEYSASESDFIVFLVCLLFARFLALFWKQNRELAARLLDLGTPVLLSEYIWPACKIWWPMPVVFVVFGLWLYPMLTHQFAMEVAIIIQDDLINEKKYPIKKVEQPELEDMVRHLIDYNEIALTNEAKASINAMQLNAVKTSDDLKTKIYPKLEQEVFPPRMPGTRTHRCGRNLSCLGSNAVKSAANSGYRKLRDPPLSVTKRNIEALHAKVGADSARFAKEAAALIEAEIKQFANNTRILFDKALYAARMFSLIMLIYSIMVLLKTYGIVLARIIFDTSNTRKFHARLSNEETDPERFNDDTPVNSNVVLLEQPHDLLRKDRHDYFFTRDVSLPAGLPMAWIPYPAKSIRSRIRPQRYLMSYADVTKGKFPIVSLQLPPTIELVRWKIAKRERVVFRWQDLVGWSKGVRVSTQISFSLQALVFGRAVFHTAEGPGILFLRARGNPIIGDSAAARQPRDAACLISWHTRTPFEVHSQLNLQGVFLRGYNVEKQAMGLVIYSSHSESGGSAILGIGRWLRTFLSPI